MDFLKGITPREYQKKILETCVEKNCLVVLPTGLGKTLIALMLSIEVMKKFPGEKVLFLAPTKPLVEQHYNYFKKYLPELFAEIELFTGSINASNRKKIWKNADIIFSTPQCIANDVKNSLYDLSEVCLLIEDEAHRCLKNYDYNFISQIYKKQAINHKILGMTASPGTNEAKIKEICRNLNINDVEIRTRESEDVKKYLQEVKYEKILVDFPPEFEEMRQVLKKVFDGYVEDLKRKQVLWNNNVNKYSLIELQKKIMATIARGNKNFNYLMGASICAQAIKIQHALELLETQTLSGFNKYLKDLVNQAKNQKSKGVVKLVEKQEFQFVFNRSNELIHKGYEHPKIHEIIKMVSKEKQKKNNSKILIFTQFRETAKTISSYLNKLKNATAKVFVGQAKKDNTGMSQKEQSEIIEEFSSGKVDVLVATSIGEEGLDIPEVNSVIFYEPVPSAIRKIQRAGRTARLMEGKVMVLVTKDTKDQSNYYASRSREKGMYKALHSIKSQLSNGNKLDFQKKLQ